MSRKLKIDSKIEKFIEKGKSSLMAIRSKDAGKPKWRKISGHAFLQVEDVGSAKSRLGRMV